jgi:hypothetical protein
MAEFSFDSSTVAPQQEFDLLPAGKYVAHVIDSEIVPTKAGTGDILKLTFEILEGEHANRKLWARLNIRNENAQAQQIGLAQLSALCHAIGLPKLTDTLELHEKPTLVTVKVRKAKPGDTYGDSNDVTGFSPVGAGAAQAKPAAQKPASATPPWAKAKAA